MAAGQDVIDKDVANISLSEFCELQRRYVEMHAKAKLMEKEVENFKGAMNTVGLKIMAIMQGQELKSMPVGDNLLTLVQRSSVPTPKTKEEKEAFFNWLRQTKGEEVYWSYMGVNSQSLNAFWKVERDLAVERQDIDFALPGVGKESITHTLSVRKR